MARNRMLNPEFWLDEDIAKLSPHARLLYMGLWNICDDNYATLPNRPAWIKAQVFPYENLDTTQLLGELSGSSKLILFRGSDEQEYWFIKNFFKYQRVEKPSKPKYPEYKPELEIKIKHSPTTTQPVVPEVKRREVKRREVKRREVKRSKQGTTAVAVLGNETSNDITFVYDIFKNHYGVSPKPIKAKDGNFDLNVAAAKRLVKVHTRPVLQEMLEFTLKYQATDKYCRISTSPLDFEKNYSWYKTYFEQKKIQVDKKRITKITED